MRQLRMYFLVASDAMLSISVPVHPRSDSILVRVALCFVWTDGSPRKLRAIRAFEDIGPRMQRVRVLAAAQSHLEQCSVPVHALRSRSDTTPAQLLHLRPRDRMRIRSVPSLRKCTPSEGTINKFRRTIAVSHHIKTLTFKTGAYLADPLAAVEIITAGSDFLAIGGDSGGGSCKLGVT
jgi:hypothetical protein